MTEQSLLERIAQQVWEPDDLVRDTLAALDGDLVVLGAAGKVGVSLSRMAATAYRQLGTGGTVYAVSRFSDAAARSELEAAGVRTVAADLLSDEGMTGLPDAANVVYMAGRKFGTGKDASATWAANVLLPGLVARRYRDSRIAAFSSGNVYPLLPLSSGGADETVPPGPVGEYAQSCLGRERIFESESRRNGTPVSIIRLNYAVDCRYGVLTDIARAVDAGEPVALGNGIVNVIWQGDANRYTLASLAHAATPPFVLNVTGPEQASVRWLAEQIGERLGKTPIFEGTETDTALISNAATSFELFDYPTVPLRTLLDWTCAWLRGGGELLDKPTHFTERTGSY